MEYKQKEEILRLSSLIFDDKVFMKIKSCLEQGAYNKLRLLIADELEQREILSIAVTDDPSLLKEIEICSRIEDVVIDYCISSFE